MGHLAFQRTLFRPTQFHTSNSKRCLYLAAICCLMLPLGCRQEELTFDAAQASFHDFAKCAVDADLGDIKLQFKDAWLQNVLSADEFFGMEDQGKTSDFEQSEEKAYIITGLIRTSADGAPPRDDLTLLLVRKVLDRYKVVNWATNIGNEYGDSLQDLAGRLIFNPYQGKCS